MTRWVSREQYETEQSVGQAAGIVGLIIAFFGGMLWFVYQGVKRPLSFFIYLLMLVAVILPISQFMKMTENGLLQFGLAFILLLFIFGACVASRGPILAIERMEGHAMVWIYNRSILAGQIVYGLLMLVVAYLGAILVHAISLVFIQLFKLDLAGWIFYVAGAGLSVTFRIMFHPLSGQINVFGRPKVEHVVETGIYEGQDVENEPVEQARAQD